MNLIMGLGFILMGLNFIFSKGKTGMGIVEIILGCMLLVIAFTHRRGKK